MEWTKKVSPKYIIYALVILITYRYIIYLTAQQSYPAKELNASIQSSRDLNRPLRKRIAFLKTHKCGSSTLTHILVAFGWKHNLNIATPRHVQQNDYSYPQKFNSSLVRPSSQPYDLLFHHARYSHQMKQMMPEDTFFFTILRDPVSHLQSSYSYFKFSKTVERQIGRNHITFKDFVLGDKSLFEGSTGQNVYNRQMFDLGFDYSDMTDEAKIVQKIDEIDRDFDFVAITELFDECLILLRDHLGWAMDDMLQFKNKMAAKKITIGESDAKQIRSEIERWNKADTILYKHFKRKIQILIRRQQFYISQEVTKLRELQAQWDKHCYSGLMSPTSDIRDCRHKSSASMVYNITVAGKKDVTCLVLSVSQTFLGITTNKMMKVKENDPTFSLRSGFDLLLRRDLSCMTSLQRAKIRIQMLMKNVKHRDFFHSNKSLPIL